MPMEPQRTHHKKSSKSLILLLFALTFVVGAGVGFMGRDSLVTQSTIGTIANREGLPDDLETETVEAVYDSLRTNFDGDLEYATLIEGLKDGLVKATGDPYTEYFDKEEAESFDSELSGSFTGIGAELGKEDSFIVIVSPLSGFPAEKAGLLPRDVIAEIDGENAYDITISDAVDKIRGEAGTSVKLTVIRGGDERIDMEITREEITIPSVEFSVRDDNIGYLKISRFGPDTASLAKQAALEFIAKNVEGIVVDVRGNPGGLLDSSVSVASLWVEQGKVIVDERSGGTTRDTLNATGNSILSSIPTVVLINDGSASASEILAGALRDHGKATLIGQKSYGKGSVQQLIDFGDGSKLKVTIARWFTPGGKNIDKEGIEPDQAIERTLEDFKAERDPQLDSAIEKLIGG